MKKFLAVVATLAAVVGCGGSSHPTNSSVHQSKTFLQQVEHPRLPASAYAPRALKGVTNIHGEDNVDLNRIPLGTPAIGCYGVGSFANCTFAAQRFPNSSRISITPTAGGVARILDVEPGDAVPSQAGPWARSMVNRGVFRPGIYASSWVMSQVRASLAANGLTHCTAGSTSKTCYILWVAAWDNNSAIPAGFDIHQYAGGNVRDYDTFASYVFAAAKPPVPLCARTMCYFKFSTAYWRNPKPGPCHNGPGCQQRAWIYTWQHDIHKSHKVKLYTRYRLQAIQRHLDYEVHHGHNNLATKRLAHIFWAAGFEAQWRSSFDKYLEVKG